MHNLSGAFAQEEKPQPINGTTYYPFSVIYPKKNRTYYCDKQNECREWVSKIRKATGYLNLTDIYDVKVRYSLITILKLKLTKIIKIIKFIGKTWQRQIWSSQTRYAQRNWKRRRY